MDYYKAPQVETVLHVENRTDLFKAPSIQEENNLKSNWQHFLREMVDKELIVADAKENKMQLSHGDIREELEKNFGLNIIDTGENRPNVLFVLADQWRYCSLGHSQNKDELVRTPNLDLFF